MLKLHKRVTQLNTIMEMTASITKVLKSSQAKFNLNVIKTSKKDGLDK